MPLDRLLDCWSAMASKARAFFRECCTGDGTGRDNLEQRESELAKFRADGTVAFSFAFLKFCFPLCRPIRSQAFARSKFDSEVLQRPRTASDYSRGKPTPETFFEKLMQSRYDLFFSRANAFIKDSTFPEYQEYKISKSM